ncbi:MAG: hypothetical protein ACJAUP_001591 [Cellvibrionaceae bacterium]|jgi:uncharacterized protein YcgL (UPF0745 family)
MTIICEIYRCSKKEGMYIYLDKKKGLDELPEALKQTTGKMELAMTLALPPEKKLARANVEEVMLAIQSQGFYLQMPPTLSQEARVMSDSINEANHKLER